MFLWDLGFPLGFRFLSGLEVFCPIIVTVGINTMKYILIREFFFYRKTNVSPPQSLNF